MKYTFTIISNYSIAILFLFLNSCKKEDNTKAPVINPVYNNCKIMGVKVLEIPPQKGPGKEWDIGSQPDIYISIIAENTTIIHTKTMIYGDNTQYPIFWNFPFPVIIGNLTTEYDLYVYDDDSPELDDIIGAMGFIPANYKNYPALLDLYHDGTKLQLELQWY